MTPEAQRIAIAEACELENVHWDLDISELVYGTGTRIRVPNYLSDLNAMHEAENILNEQQGATYALFLHKVGPNRARGDYLGKDFDVLHATAAQRAEAFLRTLNLWDDSK